MIIKSANDAVLCSEDDEHFCSRDDHQHTIIEKELHEYEERDSQLTSVPSEEIELVYNEAFDMDDADKQHTFSDASIAIVPSIGSSPSEGVQRYFADTQLLTMTTAPSTWALDENSTTSYLDEGMTEGLDEEAENCAFSVPTKSHDEVKNVVKSEATTSENEDVFSTSALQPAPYTPLVLRIQTENTPLEVQGTKMASLSSYTWVHAPVCSHQSWIQTSHSDSAISMMRNTTAEQEDEPSIPHAFSAP
uniref:Uncharacterized protein n=1 Tax=Entomoneis paludosa TaxID=265537 RepID=A0A7S2YHK1_9STRA